MMKMALLGIAAAVAVGGVASISSAGIVDPGLTGNVQTDIWDFSQVAIDGQLGVINSTNDWGHAIDSTNAGGKSATFNKVSGYGYLATDTLHGQAIYAGAFTDGVNMLGGTFEVSEPAPITDLKTVVFQVEVLEAHGIDFHSHELPTLSYNGGLQGLAASTISHTQFDTGTTFTNPETGGAEPVLVNSWLLQWDLSSISDPISSFDIDWSIVMHSRIYTTRLDQSDIYTQVPEPAMLGMLSLAGLLLVRRRHG